MSNRSILTVLFSCFALLSLAVSEACADEKKINITGNGSDAQYIEDGAAKQLNVVVTVGDTVRWTNNGDRTHTATSDVNKASGDPLFETKNIAAGASVTVTFDQALYDEAVKATSGKAGDTLHLGYFCAKHPNQMGGMLVLKPQNRR